MGAEAFIRHFPAGRGLRTREILAVGLLTGFVVLLAWILVAADVRSDLSNLHPSGKMAEPETVLIGWPDLGSRQGSSKIQRVRALAIRVRMLGYMTEAYRPVHEGDEVDRFILMPDAGQILRAARRNPHEMVEILLRRPAHFRNRELVWVSGMIEQGACAASNDSVVSYCVKDGDVWPAEQREITRWFTP